MKTIALTLTMIPAVFGNTLPPTPENTLPPTFGNHKIIFTIEA